MNPKSKIVSVEREERKPNDPVFKKLDWRFRLAGIPFIGRWLSGGGYTLVKSPKEVDNDTEENKNRT